MGLTGRIKKVRDVLTPENRNELGRSAFSTDASHM
jgi:hypothetical protein